MTLSDLMLKLEKFTASLSLDELYLFYGLVQELKGREMLKEKISKMICYKENMSRSNHEAFNDVMRGCW